MPEPIVCPTCRTPRALDRPPEPGLFLLCDRCLGVSVIDGESARAITPAEVASMPSNVWSALLEEKTRLLRARLTARAAVRDRPALRGGPTQLERAECELERVEDIESGDDE